MKAVMNSETRFMKGTGSTCPFAFKPLGVYSSETWKTGGSGAAGYSNNEGHQAWVS